MSKKDHLKNYAQAVDLKSSLLFVSVGVVIIVLSLWNWHYDIEPRLENEARSNTLVLASSYARTIESQFQNVTGKTDISVIHDSMNEMLLINDPSTGENLYFGVSLEVDYDAFPTDYDLVNLEVGTTNCTDCILTENPIYKRDSGELIAILKIYANPFFYQRLATDMVDDLALLLIGIIAVLVASFAATTLDTATRLQRYVLQELGSTVHIKLIL